MEILNKDDDFLVCKEHDIILINGFIKGNFSFIKNESYFCKNIVDIKDKAIIFKAKMIVKQNQEHHFLS